MHFTVEVPDSDGFHSRCVPCRADHIVKLSLSLDAERGLKVEHWCLFSKLSQAEVIMVPFFFFLLL